VCEQFKEKKREKKPNRESCFDEESALKSKQTLKNPKVSLLSEETAREQCSSA